LALFATQFASKIYTFDQTAAAMTWKIISILSLTALALMAYFKYRQRSVRDKKRADYIREKGMM
jgi:hypothetical protein